MSASSDDARGPYVRALGDLTEIEAKAVWGAALRVIDDLEHMETMYGGLKPTSVEILAVLRGAVARMPTKGAVREGRSAGPAARVREPCPKCGAPIRAKTMNEGGGVECSSASCNYWFCY